MASKPSQGRPKSSNDEPPLLVGQFLQLCSTFIKQHKGFVAAICTIFAGIGIGGFSVGHWTATYLPSGTIRSDDTSQLETISADLAVLSETTQSNFDGQAYFLDTLTNLLQKEGVIDRVDAQRLLTGVIVYAYQDKTADPNTKNAKSAYEKFIDEIRIRYHVTETSAFSDPNPGRGILLSSDLDDSILCELLTVEKRFDLGVRFVARAAPSQNNRDRYTIQVMSARSDIPQGSNVEEVGLVRQRCSN